MDLEGGFSELISLSSVPEKTMEVILKKAVSRNMKDKNMTRKSYLVFFSWQIMLDQSDRLLQ